MTTAPDANFNNKMLVCEAHHGGKAFKKVKAKVTLKVECKFFKVM